MLIQVLQLQIFFEYMYTIHVSGVIYVFSSHKHILLYTHIEINALFAGQANICSFIRLHI